MSSCCKDDHKSECSSECPSEEECESLCPSTEHEDCCPRHKQYGRDKDCKTIVVKLPSCDCCGDCGGCHGGHGHGHRGRGHGHGHGHGKKKRCDQPWPPKICPPNDTHEFFFHPDPDNPGQTLDDLIDEIPEGTEKTYTVFLKPDCAYTLTRDHHNEINELSIVGDPRSNVGRGYVHKGAPENMGAIFNAQFGDGEEGLGPFEIEVKGCRITVRSIDCEKDPNFDSLTCDDKLTFFYKSAKGNRKTVHCIEGGNCNNIFLRNPIKIDDCGCVQRGEGFWIHPNTTLRSTLSGKKPQPPTTGTKITNDPRLLQVQERLALRGLIVDATEKSFYFGGNGRHYALSHTWLTGNVIAIGDSDSHQALVVTGNFHIHHGGGHHYNGLVYGCHATIHATSANSVSFTAFNFIQNDTAHTAVNKSSTVLDLCCIIQPKVGVYIGSSSGVTSHGSEYTCATETAVHAQHNSAFHSEVKLGLPDQFQGNVFNHNKVAITARRQVNVFLDLTTFNMGTGNIGVKADYDTHIDFGKSAFSLDGDDVVFAGLAPFDLPDGIIPVAQATDGGFNSVLYSADTEISHFP